MKRRDFLAGAAALPIALAAERAFAQAYPSRNVTIVVPFPPGGQADLAARPVALKLQDLLGKPFVIDNRGGAGGAIGNAAVARAEPDGYTLLMTLSSLAVLPEADRLFGRPAQYEVSQLVPVARVLADPTLLAVNAAAPWKSVAELVEDAKNADIKLAHIPYRGAGPALTDLLSGEIKALASAPGVLKQHVDAGAIRVLANFGAQRIASFPNLPTFQELGYKDVEFYIWAGLFAPAKTPEPIVKQLREAMRQAMSDPQVTKTFDSAGSPPAYQDAPEFARFVETDGARLIRAVQKIGRVD